MPSEGQGSKKGKRPKSLAKKGRLSRIKKETGQGKDGGRDGGRRNGRKGGMSQ